jgi:hypothetical protein
MTPRGEWALTRRIKISARISADLTIGPGGACCEWVGGHPRSLTPAQQRRYRAARNKLLGDVARRIGGTSC